MIYSVFFWSRAHIDPARFCQEIIEAHDFSGGRRLTRDEADLVIVASYFREVSPTSLEFEAELNRLAADPTRPHLAKAARQLLQLWQDRLAA